MESHQLVSAVIRGENPGRTPVYGWVAANLKDEIQAAYGSVEAFEDHYALDMAHISGGPAPHDWDAVGRLRDSGVEVTPEVYLDVPLNPVDNLADYAGITRALEHHRRQRGRFCYLQTPGIFEAHNGPFLIENHLRYLAQYPEALREVYRRAAAWNVRFAENALDLGVDMIHVSDDWGAQNGLMFSPDMWRELIYPHHKPLCDRVKARGAFLSLHSDGCVAPVLDGVVALGYDVVHPYQESANMPYATYLEKYHDRFTLMGGVCVQTTLGFGDRARLESEIRRVFGLLRGKRWLCGTTHFVQNHCGMDELDFAFGLITRLARNGGGR